MLNMLIFVAVKNLFYLRYDMFKVSPLKATGTQVYEN